MQLSGKVVQIYYIFQAKLRFRKKFCKFYTKSSLTFPEKLLKLHEAKKYLKKACMVIDACSILKLFGKNCRSYIQGVTVSKGIKPDYEVSYEIKFDTI